MIKGEDIINEIVKQGMVKVAHPDPDVVHVFVWNSNATEQLDALIAELSRKEETK